MTHADLSVQKSSSGHSLRTSGLSNTNLIKGFAYYLLSFAPLDSLRPQTGARFIGVKGPVPGFVPIHGRLDQRFPLNPEGIRVLKENTV